MQGRQKVDFSKIEIQNLPSFKGNFILIFDNLLTDIDIEKWKQLYIAKLKACY